MRISDFIIDKLEKCWLNTFMIRRGGALFLNNSMFKNKKIKKKIYQYKPVCFIATESYYRHSLKLTIIQATTGPTSINALNIVL